MFFVFFATFMLRLDHTTIGKPPGGREHRRDHTIGGGLLCDTSGEALGEAPTDHTSGGWLLCRTVGGALGGAPLDHTIGGGSNFAFW